MINQLNIEFNPHHKQLEGYTKKDQMVPISELLSQKRIIKKTVEVGYLA